MRILAVTPYYEPEGGGLERYAHEILRRLVGRGHDVAVVCFTRSEAMHEDRAGVTVERLHPRLRIRNTPIDLAFRKRVSAWIRAFKPDLVLAHTPVPFPAEMAFLAARDAGIPFVLTYHAGRLRGSSPTLDGLAFLNRATFGRAMLEGSTAFIGVTPYVRDHALRAHRDRVAIIPPGVDSQRFTVAAPPAGPDILFVGPLSRSYRWKGVDILLKAFPRVRNELPAATLTLVGDGDRRAQLEAKAAPLGDGVRFLGRVGEARLARAYQEAAVVALPSRTDAESFGMVLAEANACGRPVVASNIGGIPDFVHDGDNGLLCRPDDAEDLAQRLLAVLGDPALAAQLGRRGRERVLALHDWDELAKATELVLLNALWGSKPSPPEAAALVPAQ